MYDNTNHDGQMLVDLLIDVESVDCKEPSRYEKGMLSLVTTFLLTQIPVEAFFIVFLF